MAHMLDSLYKVATDQLQDETNGKPSGNIVVKGCEAAGYIDPEDAAQTFIRAAVTAVLLELTKYGTPLPLDFVQNEKKT